MAAIKITSKNIVDSAFNRPWEVACEPFRVAPHIYYVGNDWVGSFLLDYGEGLALIDCAIPSTLYLLTESIRKLGFDPMNIKHIFLSHGHADHDGAVVHLKNMTNATIWLSKEEQEQFRMNKNISDKDKFPTYGYDPDCYYDWEPIQLGNLVVRPKLTPGHTPGTTSFFVEDQDENGNKLVWAMHGGVGVNTLNDEYLEKTGLPKSLQQRFLDDCEAMKSIHVDICTPSHPAHSDMLQRVAEDRMDYTVFIQPDMWPTFLAERAEMAKEVMKNGFNW